MTDQPRYATLQDYVRVLRRNRMLLAVLAFAGAVCALALSLAQTKQYEATADVSFRDVLADLDFFSGDDSPPELLPLTRATINAQTLTRPEVSQRVKDELETDLSIDELAAAVTTRVDQQTNLVRVTGTSSDPQFAADLANEYALAAQRIGTQSELTRVRDFVTTVERELTAARRDLPQTTFLVGSLTQQLSRLRLLEARAEPVQIARRATAPVAPVSPRPVRNTLLGALVGLLLGLLAAFVRDALDRRIRTAHDVHQELDSPVVGRVRETAFGYSGLVPAEGRLMRAEDFEAFRVLRTNLAYLKQGGPRTILVTSANPEEGKSTVSMSLASAAAVAGHTVLLVEADLRRPCFARRLGVNASPGLTDYLEGEVPPSAILQVVTLADPPSLNGLGPAPTTSESGASIVCISAGSPTTRATELLSGRRFDDFISKVGRAYDLVVMDSSPLLAVADPLALTAKVETVLVCVRANETMREHVRATREALSHAPESGVGAVVTGLRDGDPDGGGYYYGY